MAEEQSITENVIYKKWFRTKDQTGFLTIDYWAQADRLSVEVGSRQGEGEWSTTKCWVDAKEFGTYMRAVAQGGAARLYPADEKNRLPAPESFVTYGGGKTQEAGPVSRILRVHYWSGKDEPLADNSFAFKCEHYKAKEGASGAFIPDLQSPISRNKIKVSRKEMAEISYRIDMCNIASTVVKELRTND